MRNVATQTRLSGIQVARAVAALSIAYFHSGVALVRFPPGTAFPIPGLSGFGWLAVDLFFAISGFVICLVASRRHFNVGTFLIKRVFRLYPLWLATLTIFAVLALLWRRPTETETLGYFVYSATLLPTKEFPFYNIGWSLQHEMIFYIAAAIIVPISGLYGLAAFLTASTVLFHSIEMPWYLSSLAMYHSEFLAGVVAFIARAKLARFGFWIPFAIGFGLLWCSVTIWSHNYAPLALFFLVTGFSNIRDSNQRWMKPISMIGDASYSIYLIHPLVFLVASALTSKISLPIWSQEPIRATCLATIIGISLLSWRYFERPIIKIGNDLAARRVPPKLPRLEASLGSEGKTD